MLGAAFSTMKKSRDIARHSVMRHLATTMFSEARSHAMMTSTDFGAESADENQTENPVAFMSTRDPSKGPREEEDEWEERRDPSSGVAYYFSKQTGVSTWTRPEPKPEPSPAAVAAGGGGGKRA